MTALAAAALLIFGILGLAEVVSRLVLAIVCLVAGVLLLVSPISTGLRWPRRQ